MKKEYLEAGKVCTAHGVRGLLKVESWCDSPKVLAAQKRVFLADGDGKYEERKVISASVMGELVLMGIEGITSREDAFAYKNKIFYLHRSDVPVKRGAVLIADMIGLDVIDAQTGKIYGTLVEVSDAARGQLYTVKCNTGEVLLPAVPEFIKEIDVERGVFITPIPGFFDEADEV
jgi:16S rRNA processing protein RimM